MASQTGTSTAVATSTLTPKKTITTSNSTTLLTDTANSQPTRATLNDWLELARFWRPAGVVAFHIPLVVGSLFHLVTRAGTVTYTELLASNVQLLLASFLQRCAACAWNDAADYKFDKQVARTRNRPIPRGSIDPVSARLYAAGLTIAWFLAVIWPYGSQAVIWTIAPNFVFHLAYPYMKRITQYPSVFLGFTFSLNVLTGYAMAGDWSKIPSTLFQDQNTQLGLASLMFAQIAFAVFCDTVYAYQDVADDEKAGVGSIALELGYEGGKMALASIAIVEVGSLVVAGWSFDAGFYYYIMTCGGSALLSIAALIACDLKVPGQCGAWFKRYLYNGLWIQMAGFLAEYLWRV